MPRGFSYSHEKAVILNNRFFYCLFIRTFAKLQPILMAHTSIDTDNPEFQNALRLIQYTRQSVFLTGKAGTGKSTFLKHVCQVTKKKYVVLAPTGISAINAGGSTLHSFFKLPFHPLLPNDPRFQGSKLYDFLKYNSNHRKLIQNLELIIIDEISMVRADIIDFIDKILRTYSHNLREPFGGKQVLLVGDIFQLEPVVKSEEREILNRFYPNPYFFSAMVFQQMELVAIELTKVYRQSDEVFIGILNRIRTNTVQQRDLQLLNTRYQAPIQQRENDLYITLATRRDTVDYINEQRLEKLEGKPVILKGELHGEFPENSLPTLMELVVKQGAQVIFIKNDVEKRWVNGTIGTIMGITDQETIYVRTENGAEYEVERESWSNVRYRYNEEENKIEEEELGTFTQYPLRLAWAITVHKSQGLTFTHTVIDFTGGVFAGGQTYVALSRCTSLEGIQLKREITRSDIFVRPEIVAFSQRFNDNQAVERALKQARADEQYIAAVKAFDSMDFAAFLDYFFKAIHSRYDIEKPPVQRLIRKKLGIIRTLKEENKRLKEELRERQKSLEKYAHEYYLMGNECILKAHDARAAIANFDKAIELCPEYTEAWIRKGVTLFDEDRTDEAEACLNEAVRQRPNEFKAVYNRGKLYLFGDRLEEALADLDKATSLKPQHSGAHSYFAEALEKTGKKAEAAIHRRIAKELKKRK